MQHTWESGPFRLLSTPQAKNTTSKDDKHVAFATLMALIHNCWIRALNGLYQEAPFVAQGDLHSFLGYAQAVYAAIHKHHEDEEHSV